MKFSREQSFDRFETKNDENRFHFGRWFLSTEFDLSFSCCYELNRLMWRRCAQHTVFACCCFRLCFYWRFFFFASVKLVLLALFSMVTDQLTQLWASAACWHTCEKRQHIPMRWYVSLRFGVTIEQVVQSGCVIRIAQRRANRYFILIRKYVVCTTMK